MISIAICDNEVQYLNIYENKLNILSKKHNIDLEIIRFSNGESLLFYLEDNPNKFNIFYLDIVMDKINGIDTARKIREFNPFSKIIFLTTSESYVFSSFDVNPTHYLLKTLHDDKFEKVFLNAINLVNQTIETKIFSYKVGKDQASIAISDIIYFESNGRLISIITSKEIIEYYDKISVIFKSLNEEDFIMPHRSYIVNMAYIKKLTRNEIYLKNGSLIPLSRNLYEQVSESYLKYLNKISLK